MLLLIKTNSYKKKIASHFVFVNNFKYIQGVFLYIHKKWKI